MSRSFKDFLSAGIAFLLLLWGIHLVGWLFNLQLQVLGLRPREVRGLLGILTMPLLHGGWGHLLNNTFSLVLSGLSLWLFYRPLLGRVTLGIWLGSGALLWVLGQPANHIGASGLIYGWVFFLLFSGLFRLSIRSIVAALLTLFLNQGILWGLLPIQPGVSWDGHLYGALVGVYLAWVYRKKPVGQEPRRRGGLQDGDPRIPDQLWDYRSRMQR